MMIPLFFQILFYLTDGFVWLLADWLLVTKFLGYPVKPSRHRRALFCAAVLLHAACGAGFYLLATALGESSVFSVGNISFLFLIYGMFVLREPKRLKRFFILFSADQILNAFITVFLSLSQMPPLNAVSSSAGGVFVFLFLLLFVLGIIALFSRFSSRRRREPMRFLLVVSLCIFCTLLDFAVSSFQPAEFEGFQPSFSIKATLLSAEALSTAIMYAVLIVSGILLALFLVLTVRDSESAFFQKKNTVNEYYLETQKEHHAGLIESDRAIRKIKHDMKNHIYCLKELYRNENYEELGRYLDEMDENIRHADSSIHVGNEIADAIITEKTKKAAEKHILLETDGDMSGVAMSALDICTILSNILDNAIEAVEALPEDAQRKIILTLRKNNNFLLITAKNPTDRNLEITDNQIATTKKDKGSHGFGLVNIAEAAAKYDGESRLSVTKQTDGYEFTIEVMIPLASENAPDFLALIHHNVPDRTKFPKYRP